MRALTQRGYAMLQAGTKTHAELIDDPQFSVEVTGDMKVTEMAVHAQVLSASEEPNSEENLNDENSVELTELTEQLTTANANLVTATDQLNAANTEIAALKETITNLESKVTTCRPLMESAVNGLQMRMKGATADLKGKKEEELVSMFNSLSTEFTKTFPAGQVSVVADKGENLESPSVSLDLSAVQVYHRANRVGKKQ